jgi:hypothetical protein
MPRSSSAGDLPHFLSQVVQSHVFLARLIPSEGTSRTHHFGRCQLC